MTSSGIVTLLTDFGLEDPFVGVMHAVVMRHFPSAKIVDLAHGVAPHSVLEGAFWLEKCHVWFPAGTVHVAVVDPGVGTDRAALVVETGEHVFVAPDNGLVGELAHRSDAQVHRVELTQIGLELRGRTFHGRDVFAPIGARIAAGHLSASEVGPRADAFRLPRRERAKSSDRVGGTVVSIDRFGNLITDIEAEEIEQIELPLLEIVGRSVMPAASYGEVPRGEALFVVSSFGTVEIAVREGNAAERFGVERGTSVVVRSANTG
jgi:S-adenosyl-L-methionine hydrolase (adenosine-forming)